MAADLTNLSAIEQLVLAKLVNEKALDQIRPQVSAGDYEVDFIVRIKGLLEVNEDSKVSASIRLPWMLALAVAVQRSGVQGPNIVESMVEILQEALNPGEDSEETEKLAAYADQAKRRIRKAFNEVPKVTRKGAVKAHVKVGKGRKKEGASNKGSEKPPKAKSKASPKSKSKTKAKAKRAKKKTWKTDEKGQGLIV